MAQVGEGAGGGPFAFLRPGTDLGAHGKIGTFVETKNAQIGEGSKVPHLSYVGDATIGRHSNIGSSSVFANYNGLTKQRTTIGDHCRDAVETADQTVVRFQDAWKLLDITNDASDQARGAPAPGDPMVGGLEFSG